jgi:thiamine pyrophosphate-dependent acetolactate synthase large subunit-like protein
MTVTLQRNELIAELLDDRPKDLLVVTGLGSSTYDVLELGDNPKNFYLWGAMGQSVPVGLGIAVAQPEKRVLIVTGDGELLMGLTGLSAAGNAPARNVAILVMDNGHYSETGGQPTHTSGQTNLAGVAEQCGFRKTLEITKMSEMAKAKRLLLDDEGPIMVVAKVALRKYGQITEPQSRIGHYMAARFRMAVTGRGEAALDT